MAAPQQLLTIDCGNSTIRCRRADLAIWATDSMRPDFADLASFVGLRPTRALAVSVVSSALTAIRKALPNVHVAVADVDLKCPLQLAYKTKATLGADRWLGAFAAYRRFGAAITVDCGTATTVNVVDAAGVFHGGAIAPGLAAFVAGLSQKASALPAANLDAAPVMPANSTQGCIDAGVLLGWAGLVERLVRDALRYCPTAKLVVTGGNAERLRRLGVAALDDEACAFVPELLHDGLAELAATPHT
ncbi:MAG: type III pantothenate kinase [Planctomycetota bacterium]